MSQASRFDQIVPPNPKRIDDQVELKRLRRLEARVKEFEKASGIDISKRWDGKKVGAAVNFVLSGGVRAQKATIEGLKNRAQELIDTCEIAMAQSE